MKALICHCPEYALQHVADITIIMMLSEDFQARLDHQVGNGYFQLGIRV